jgi:hypothetical protein
MAPRDEFDKVSQEERAIRTGQDPDKQDDVTESDIRTAAYFLWEARGCVHGYDQADWYAAEILLHRRTVISRPEFHKVDAALILDNLEISHCGLHDFFNPSISWIEVSAHPKTIFEWDRNRRLHFDEGFLWACHRIFKDLSITHIAQSHHFPYRDLDKFRSITDQLLDVYRQGANLLPPLFFYSAPYKFEILDGVHRCLAAFELTRALAHAGDFSCADYLIWLGFNHDQFRAEVIAHQLWVSSLCYSEIHV